MKRVLFVCLGNICRSPAAEGILREKLKRRGLESSYFIDSAGTAAYHIGESPDHRMREMAISYGYPLHGKARQFESRDFEEFDLILAMDQQNLRDMERLNSGERKVKLFREFDPKAQGDLSVPDPYFGGDAGFREVVEIIERTADQIIDHLESQK